MKKPLIFAVPALCLLLAACGNANIGVIGGADGPAAIYIGEKSDDFEKQFSARYIDTSKLNAVSTNIQRAFTSDDRTLTLDDEIENLPELTVYDFYRNETDGNFKEIKNAVTDDFWTSGIENEEKSFKNGIYLTSIHIDEIEVLDSDDVKNITTGNKKQIIEKLDSLGMREFCLVEVEAEIKHNEKSLSLAPQVGDGEIERYYLLGKTDDGYKIAEVYWEGFLND